MGSQNHRRGSWKGRVMSRSQIELISIPLHGRRTANSRPSNPRVQVIGNVIYNHHTNLENANARRPKDRSCLQLQQGQVGVTVIRFVFALLGNIVLENGRCLRIVSVETIEYGIDMIGPIWRRVECRPHHQLGRGGAPPGEK